MNSSFQVRDYQGVIVTADKHHVVGTPRLVLSLELGAFRGCTGCAAGPGARCEAMVLSPATGSGECEPQTLLMVMVFDSFCFN